MTTGDNSEPQNIAHRRLANIGNVIVVSGTIEDEPRVITTDTVNAIKKFKAQPVAPSNKN